jgi:hypothetical protein
MKFLMKLEERSSSSLDFFLMGKESIIHIAAGWSCMIGG